jgi:UDP-3-O-[3-hydroxymyristoyl] glucosamine N-acyltransferase
MRNIKVKEILYLLNESDSVIGDTDYYFNNVPPSEHVNEESLDWINPIKKDKLEYLLNSKARVIICDKSINNPEELQSTKCLILVENPKLTFLRIASTFFLPKAKYGIHPTATIHPSANISDKCYIGPYSYIGKSTVGDETIIYGHCHIYDQVTIGRQVTIHAGTVIGADGFGYQRNEKGEFEKFPHIGGIIIKDNVEIGANTCIDRGALGNTIIEEGVKIDNLVHIAHNVSVGKHTAIIANTMIGGSTSIGEYSWIAPSVCIRDQLVIGNKVTVGMGSIVTKNIPNGETWLGAPAKPIAECLENQKIDNKINSSNF